MRRQLSSLFCLSRHYIVVIIGVLAAVVMLWTSHIQVQYFNDNTLQPTVVRGVDFPKTLIDATGDELVLLAAPERIVSVTLGSDEILTALVDQQRVVGVTDLVDDARMSNIPYWYPASIQRIRGEVEEILALQPDLVIVTRYTRAETVRLLFGSGIPVLRLSGGQTFKDIAENITIISQVTGTEGRGRQLLAELRAMTQGIKSLVDSQPRPRVLFYHLDGYTAGEGSTVDEMIRVAGGLNVVREAGIKGSYKISEEMAIGMEPDVIFVSGNAPNTQAAPFDFLKQHPNWQHVPAVQNNRVYELQGRWLVSVSQHSWDGIKEIATLLHPEVFE